MLALPTPSLWGVIGTSFSLALVQDKLTVFWTLVPVVKLFITLFIVDIA